LTIHVLLLPPPAAAVIAVTAVGNVSKKGGKKHSYFLATDAKLLDIMDQQGLACATHAWSI
jgi:hypothetical protein